MATKLYEEYSNPVIRKRHIYRIVQRKDVFGSWEEWSVKPQFPTKQRLNQAMITKYHFFCAGNYESLALYLRGTTSEYCHNKSKAHVLDLWCHKLEKRGCSILPIVSVNKLYECLMFLWFCHFKTDDNCSKLSIFQTGSAFQALARIFPLDFDSTMNWSWVIVRQYPYSWKLLCRHLIIPSWRWFVRLVSHLKGAVSFWKVHVLLYFDIF